MMTDTGANYRLAIAHKAYNHLLDAEVELLKASTVVMQDEIEALDEAARVRTTREAMVEAFLDARYAGASLSQEVVDALDFFVDAREAFYMAPGCEARQAAVSGEGGTEDCSQRVCEAVADYIGNATAGRWKRRVTSHPEKRAS